MNFIYKEWDKFCKKLVDEGVSSVPVCEIFGQTEKYFCLKHDVETAVKKAYKISKIESKYGHKGSYYVQAYLLKKKSNVKLLKKMQEAGHEISYHYDVLDFAKGDFEKAVLEYEKNVLLFEENGFPVRTVCQHGNPILERKNYTSNRDFFRNGEIEKKFNQHTDVMVNLPKKAKTEYAYYSDAGRKFKFIFDPLFNDVIPSDDKNIAFENLEKLYESVGDRNVIVSMHPHRWEKSALVYHTKTFLFKIIRKTVKLLAKIPIFKKFLVATTIWRKKYKKSVKYGKRYQSSARKNLVRYEIHRSPL